MSTDRRGARVAETRTAAFRPSGRTGWASLFLVLFLSQLAVLTLHEWQVASRAQATPASAPAPGLPAGDHHDESACTVCKSLFHAGALLAPSVHTARPEQSPSDGLLAGRIVASISPYHSFASGPRAPPIRF